MKVKKILFLGASGSGKITALEHINNNENVYILSFDYGKAVISNDTTYLFSSPGIEGFKFTQDVLTDDIDGIIIVIDNAKGITETDAEIINFIDAKDIPYIIFANKQDLSTSNLKIDFDALIIPTIATEGIGINDGLKMLLKLTESAKKQGEKPKEVKDTIEDIKSANNIKNNERPDFRNIIKKIKPVNEQDVEKAEICKLKLFMHPIELENVKNALEEVGFSNITIIEVGYVDNPAIKKESYRGSNYNITLPQRIEINMMIKREDAQYVIQTIETIKTEDIYENIFISPIENVIRIRTEEMGEEAIE